MKKRVLFCAAVLCAASMMFGFDSSETVESVWDKSNEASVNAKGATADTTCNFDVNLSIADGESTSELPIKVTMDMDMIMNTDPIAMQADSTVNISALFQDQTMGVKLYGETDENGKLTMYTCVAADEESAPTWQYQSVDLPANPQNFAIPAATLENYGVSLTLAPEPAQVDGKECYVISSVIDKNAFDKLISYAEEKSGEALIPEEVKGYVDTVLESLKIKFEYCIDTQTYYPVKAHIDFNDTDMTGINSLVAQVLGDMAEGSDISVTLNDTSMDISMTYSDTANEITIPQEALDAVSSGEAVSVDDVLASVEAGEIAAGN